ncbi:hypothetical protein C8P68_10713 [Mucilaginibacter yixingensis]|uniref:Uncharacterized protein n=1 Tax=Mucilaginibacter yixingensis TaxID=1295612 RepID=A0A2T5J679_9SPHI|nr:hypothetical protein C8P68_10713 [Mucilaginibacter yixingensis]
MTFIVLIYCLLRIAEMTHRMITARITIIKIFAAVPALKNPPEAAQAVINVDMTKKIIGTMIFPALDE